MSPTTTTYAYEAAFNKPIQVTGPPNAANPAGLVSAMTYDPSTGNLLSATADVGGPPHLSARSGFTYNSVGLVASSTGPLGTLTQHAYDGFGNRLSTVADAGPGRLNQTTTFAYNSRGDPVSVTDPRGKTTTSTYDANRRPLTTTTPGTPAAPGGVTTTNTYTSHGSVTQTKQPPINPVRFSDRVTILVCCSV